MTEYDKAKEWRRSHDLTQLKLAQLTGYSSPAISWFERGLTPPRNARHPAGPTGDKRTRRIKPEVWHRYKLACAAVDRLLKTGKPFNWE